MRSRGRNARIIGLCAAFFTGAAACASNPPPRRGGALDSGRIDPSTAPAPARPAAPLPQERWDLTSQLAALQPATKRARSGHITGEMEADVLAGAAGTYPKLGPESRQSPGATLVERLFEPGGATPAAYFVMVKRAPGFDPPGGDWEYLVVTPVGAVEQRGPLPLCARCHAEAPNDRLFGARR